MAAIPISQIYLHDGPEDELPPQLAALSASVQRILPPSLGAHRIYRDSSLRDFLSQHYEREVLQAYNKLIPYAYKADLGRYALLLHQGGWYFDIGTRLHNAIQFRPKTELVLFRE